MSLVKKTAFFLGAGALVGALVLGWLWLRSWPWRFQGELDRFFGEGEWECLSEESKESKMYSVTFRRQEASPKEYPGRFHEWDIAFQTPQGEEAVWTISDHTMRINHSEHFILSSKRYSARQALVQELMELSFALDGEAVRQQVLGKVLPQRELDCVEVSFSYRGGNPPTGFYDTLWDQPWFNLEEATIENYLDSGLYDFYIRVQAHDYRVEELEEGEKDHLMDSLPALCQALEEQFGADVPYEIYLGEGQEAESGE